MPGRPRAPRRRTAPQRLLAFRRWELDPDGRVFRVDGEEVALTRTEFNILELLMARPQKVFTKQELFELAWGEPYSVEDSTVNVHVSNLRRKLKPTGHRRLPANRVGHGLQTAQCLTGGAAEGCAAHRSLTFLMLLLMNVVDLTPFPVN